MKKVYLGAGSDTLYKGRKEVRSELAKGNKPVLTHEEKESKIILLYDGQPCGHMSPADIDEIKDIFATNPDDAVILRAVEPSGTGFKFEVRVKAITKSMAISTSEIDEEVKRIVNDKIDTGANLAEKLVYMKKASVPQAAMLRIFKSYVKYDDEVAGRIVKAPKVAYRDTARIIAKSVTYLAGGRNLLFEGDRGVGKNVATETLSWLTNRPLYEFSMNSQHDNSSLLGSSTLILEDGESVVSFDTSAIVQAAENGGILVFDEFNTSLGHIMSIMNALLDDRRRITVPGYKTIDAHQNFIAIATQNRNYTDTFANNEATSDRFVPVIFPSQLDIKSVLTAKVGELDEEILDVCSKIFESIRSSVEAGAIDEKSQTVRGFIDACIGYELGLPLKEALIDNLANRAIEVDERESIKGIIDMFF